jgi:transcriptional regulator with XRE-family HTH domain
MFDFSTMPITPELCRAARNYFGFSQAKAAEESGLPAHKIKRFEAGNYIPDQEFLQDLRSFFERKGYVFDDTPAPGAKAKSAGRVFPGGVVGDNEGADDAGEVKPYRDRKSEAKVHHMRIALKDEGEMGRALDLIEENEEKVTKLLQSLVKAGFFDLTEDTKANHAEAVRLLAENGMLFAKLFGRDVGGKPQSLKASNTKPTTTGDLLHNLQADAHLVVTGDANAKDRRAARKAPASISQALGLS